MHFQRCRPQPHFEDDNVENLRAKSFLEWEDDVPMKGILDQNKEKLSNQEIKTLCLLFKELLPVGQAVVQAGMDLAKGHIYWLIT